MIKKRGIIEYVAFCILCLASTFIWAGPGDGASGGYAGGASYSSDTSDSESDDDDDGTLSFPPNFNYPFNFGSCSQQKPTDSIRNQTLSDLNKELSSRFNCQDHRGRPNLESFHVRDTTLGKFLKALKSKHYGCVDDIRNIHQTDFAYKTGLKHNATNKYLEGQVVSWPVTMALDASWQPMATGQTPFRLAHIAFPNIGEKKKSSDCSAYKMFESNGRLDEAKFKHALEAHFNGLLKHAHEKGTTDIVYIGATGLGAFIKHAHKHYGASDENGFKEKLRDLYQQAFLTSLNKYSAANSNLTLHIVATETTDRSDEARWNKLSSSATGVQISVGVDAAILAQTLATQYGHKQVMLVIGSNRTGPGNRFYHSGAKKAMEENIYRRLSYRSQMTGLLVTQGANDQRDHRKYQLLAWIKKLKSVR